MIVFLAGAILAHVRDLGVVQRSVFGALFALSLYMLLRAGQAGRTLAERRGRWHIEFIDHVGFTLIALFEGFIIVGAIDLGTPGWVTGALALAGVVAGNRVLHGVKTQAQDA